MKKLTELTKEQSDGLVKVKNDWIKLVTTGETDEEAAKLAIRQIYENGGLQPPKVIIFLDSPIKCLQGRFIAAAYLNIFNKTKVDDQVRDQVGAQVRDQVDAQVDDQVDDQVYAQVRDQVGAQVDAQVDAQVRAQVYAQVYAQVRDQVYDQVDAQVYAQVGAQVHAQVRAQVRAQVGAQVYDQVDDQVYAQVGAQVDAQVGAQVGAQVDAQVGAQVDAQVRDQVDAQVDAQVRDQVDAQVYAQVGAQVDAQVDAQMRAQQLWQHGTFSIWWSAWWVWRKTCLDLVGQASKADAIIDMWKAHASWVWLYPEIAMVCRMPKISRDEKGRLHSTTEGAVVYPDGYSLYFLHGVAFSAEEFEGFKSGKTTAIEIMAEKNQDKKRVLAMCYGNEKLVQELNAECVNEEIDDLGHTMRLLVINRIGDEPMVYYEAIDPAKNEKVYLRVPPEFKDKTATEAKLWTFKELFEMLPKLKDRIKFEQEA